MVIDLEEGVIFGGLRSVVEIHEAVGAAGEEALRVVGVKGELTMLNVF